MEVLQPSNLRYFTEKKEPQSLKNFSKILKIEKKKNKRMSKKKKKHRFFPLQVFFFAKILPKNAFFGNGNKW